MQVADGIQQQSSAPALVSNIFDSVSKSIIGQEDLIKKIVVCLLADGHVLLESMPGLAKTTTAKAIAATLNASFHRIQFTPDLLPADIIGSDMYEQATSSFTFRKGPIFHNIVLADEINRAPAKVQSALLEAMAERQITVGSKSYPLDDLFFVMATQNPIEHEGTYQLPEAQLDRFLMHIPITYPSLSEELQILELESNYGPAATKLNVADILQARNLSQKTFIDPKLKNYIVALVQATRKSELYAKDIAPHVRYGASPRASLGILAAAKALAWIEGHEFVLPEHINYVAPAILRHRIILEYTAVVNDVSADEIVTRLLETVAVP